MSLRLQPWERGRFDSEDVTLHDANSRVAYKHWIKLSIGNTLICIASRWMTVMCSLRVKINSNAVCGMHVHLTKITSLKKLSVGVLNFIHQHQHLQDLVSHSVRIPEKHEWMNKYFLLSIAEIIYIYMRTRVFVCCMHQSLIYNKTHRQLLYMYVNQFYVCMLYM